MLNQKQVNESWVEWIAKYEWDVYATLNFRRVSLLDGNRIDAAGKLWRSCLATLDQAIYGQTRKNQPRFRRVAFKQNGKNGTNPHVHILAKSPIDVHEFCIAWNAVWASRFDASANPVSNSIAPLITKTGATDYGLHEELESPTGSYDERLSYHFTDVDHFVRTDALQRLRAQANETTLLQARLALPEHINKSQATYKRRTRLKSAALLRL